MFRNLAILFIFLGVTGVLFIVSCSTGGNGSENSSSSNISSSEILSSSSNSVSSSSLIFSSSSSIMPSSSSIIIVYGEPVIYEGETYPTVIIGTQTWFAKNLNYNANGSRCYSNNPDNCVKYGRLYDWATAMSISSTYNDGFFYEASPNHQGICPEGWRIPSDTDWSILINYVDGTGGSTPRSSTTAGKYLKATSGWNDNGNGTDDYGFAALPGGMSFKTNDAFMMVTYYGYWWSSSEIKINGAYIRSMDSNADNVLWYDDVKSILRSIRCLRNDSNLNSSSSIMPSSSSSSSSSVKFVECSTYDSSTHFCDTRDGKVYKWVEIGTQKWMAENLNYEHFNAACYDNSYIINCTKYGRLYDWRLAIESCPIGWHLPDTTEWNILINYIGGKTEGRHLKAAIGWENNRDGTGNGEDTYGFAALPGGYCSHCDYSYTSFKDIGYVGIWWTNTSVNVVDYDDNLGAYYLRIDNHSDENISNVYGLKSPSYSVRCIGD